MPCVSVLMSVRNGADYIERSLTSLLRQTFSDFELIIVDDGSDDDTPLLLEKARSTDLRIHLIKNIEPLGLTRSLNIALQQARGRYVARQDADDWSREDRFEKQVAYLESNTSVVLLGSSYVEVDQFGHTIRTCHPPVSDASIRWQMCFYSAFCHSAVMIRTEAIRLLGGYNEAYAYSQDFELWSRLASVGNVFNLREPLVFLRRHSCSVSSVRKIEQDRLACVIASQNFSNYLGEGAPMPSQISLLREWFYSTSLRDIANNLPCLFFVLSLQECFFLKGNFSIFRFIYESLKILFKASLLSKGSLAFRVIIFTRISMFINFALLRKTIDNVL